MPQDHRTPRPRFPTLPFPGSVSGPPSYTMQANPIQRPLTPPTVGGDRRTSSTWSPTQDRMLMQARQQGKNWGPIAQDYFPDKTPNACRKRHERLMMHNDKTGDWDSARMEALAKAYLTVRPQMWELVANEMGGEKWTVLEAKCMEKGLKTLMSAGKTAIKRKHSDPDSHDSDEDDDVIQPPQKRAMSHRSDDGVNDYNLPRAAYPTLPLPRQSPVATSGPRTPPGSHHRLSISSSNNISPVFSPSMRGTVLFPSEVAHPSRHSPNPTTTQTTLPSFSAAFSGLDTNYSRQPVTTLG